MDRRKEELEKKRQKLAELRRAREERKALLESQSAQSASVRWLEYKKINKIKQTKGNIKVDNHR